MDAARKNVQAADSDPADLAATMHELGRRARTAARALALAEPARKTAALKAAAQAIRD